MSATVGQMVADLELRFTASKPSDDFEGSDEQFRYWLDNANGALLPDWIRKVNSGIVPAIIIRRFPCLCVTVQTPECVGGCCSYTYVQLPVNPITLIGEMGVIEITRGVQQIYRLPSPTMLSVMSGLKGGATTPYFYRIADKLFLFNGIYPSYSKITVLGAFADSSTLSENDLYPTVEELIPQILDEAEKIGRRQFQVKQDLQDDGIAK